VTASVSDQSGLAAVRLVWRSPDGVGHTSAMTLSQGAWRVTVGPIQVGGTLTMHVVATDVRGNSAAGPSASVSVNPCPQ
jgi:hypothetical protein